MLKVIDIKHHYDDGDSKRHILKGINYEFENGKVYTIAGPSGSGKTTFLSIIAGLDQACSGSVVYSGKDIKKMGLTNYRKHVTSIVFQAYNLINYMTAYENVVTAMEISNEKNRRTVAEKCLADVGFDTLKSNRLVLKLSGGEQQRVAIARSLSTNPDIILADEPTGNLDNSTELEIIDIFKNLAHEKNKCVIIVTHSKEVEEMADVRIQLKNGLFVVK